ncbi:MAG: hypothetical protein ACREKM_11880, partial [Longimicrobiales bacterium]
ILLSVPGIASAQAQRPQTPERGKAQGAQSPGQSQGRGKAQGAQSPGQSQGRGKAQGTQGQGRGNADRAQPPGRDGAAANRAAPDMRGRGRAGNIPPGQLRNGVDRLDPEVRRYVNSDRPHERFVAGAAARGLARGASNDAMRFESVGERMRVTNGRGDILLEIDDDDARRLGAWDVRRLGDRRPTDNAPAFCESGAGHPVWGREWCLDKGFGLGSQRGYLWGRSDIEDIIWRRNDRDRLDRGGLLDVLGDIVFQRLALHALSLGATEPIGGVWLQEPNAPRILQINAGRAPIAEMVDVDRDDRVDTLFIITPLW